MKKSLALIAFLILSTVPALAQTGGANQLAHGTLAQRPATCRVSRGEVYIQTDTAGDGRGLYVCLTDNTWTKAGISDHGQLTGLSDDDHAQYLTITRGDARYHTQAALDILFSGKANTSHAHVIADTTGLQAALDAKATAASVTSEASARAAADALLQPTSEKNQNNGYAGLDGSGLVADIRLPASIARDSEVTSAVSAEATARDAAISAASTTDRDRANHTGTQSADTLTDGTTNKAFLATEQTKLAGIATGATANATDAQLRDRSTHTGTQTAATVSDFNAAALAAAPAETAATAGTLISGATGKATPVDADSVGLSDSAASNVLKKLTWANIKATLKTYFDTLYPSGSGTHSGTSSGTNTGDQTSIVGITGTTAQFNTALTDGDFATLAGSEALTSKTYNGLTVTTTTGTLTVANSKTLTVNNTLTLAGTDGTTQTFPNNTGTVANLNLAQTWSANQTLAADLLSGTDGGRTIGAAASGRFNAYFYGVNIGNTGAVSAGILKVGATTSGMALQSGFMQLGSAVGIGWSSGDVFSVGEDTRIKRAKAAVIDLTNASTGGGTFRAVATSPAQITADQNNYTLSSGAPSYFIRLTSDASRSITGLSISQVDGEVHTIINVGSNNIVLVHESASSTATNRFKNSTGADITLSANQAADLIFDNTQSRWLVFKRN